MIERKQIIFTGGGGPLGRKSVAAAAVKIAAEGALCRKLADQC